jgi:hypothetical protein
VCKSVFIGFQLLVDAGAMRTSLRYRLRVRLMISCKSSVGRGRGPLATGDWTPGRTVIESGHRFLESFWYKRGSAVSGVLQRHISIEPRLHSQPTSSGNEQKLPPTFRSWTGYHETWSHCGNLNVAQRDKIQLLARRYANDLKGHSIVLTPIFGGSAMSSSQSRM